MRATAKIDEKQIDEMDLTIAFTMTTREWRQIMRQTPDAWPSSQLGQHIAHVLGHITRATSANIEVA